MALDLLAAKRAEVGVRGDADRRGEINFAPADVRVRSRLGLCELIERIGRPTRAACIPISPGRALCVARRRPPPAGDRHQDLPAARRRHGLQAARPSTAPAIRCATSTGGRRCARRSRSCVNFRTSATSASCCSSTAAAGMRADDRRSEIGTDAFRPGLNAVMLLSYVALKQGDAVGAMTFGTTEGEAAVRSAAQGRAGA